MCALVLGLVAAAAALAAADLKLTGIAHVAVRVSDIAKSRDFYGRVLGLAEPFQMSAKGELVVAFLKVNDRQFIELYPGLPPGEDLRLAHVCLESADIQQTFDQLTIAGLNPKPVRKAGAGNMLTLVHDPDGQTIEFLQYLPGSLHRNEDGKSLSPRRVSTRLLHAGVMASDEQRSMAFYRDQLGLSEVWRWGPSAAVTSWINLRIPGEQAQYLEVMLHQRPPTREGRGSMQHICLEVPDIQAAWKLMRQRGIPDDENHRPRLGRNKRWQLNLWDPDGTRVELMEPKPVE
ncbi:MAG: VOC family protein [Acidobacteria bacterium]|nr:VOC family protein [Acidobacteriota bacterium]